MSVVDVVKRLFVKTKSPVLPVPPVTEYWQRRVSEFKANPAPVGSTIMVGDSITEGAGNYPKLFPCRNRGISGDTTIGVVNRLPIHIEERPATVLLLIGTNNLGWGTKEAISRIVPDLIGIVQSFQAAGATIVLQTLLPINRYFPLVATRDPEHIKTINEAIANISQARQVPLVDLYLHFAGADGNLMPGYTFDGLHINEAGYQLWSDLLKQRGFLS